jgi:NAD-dependent SIR2 family protein deacetylase
MSEKTIYILGAGFSVPAGVPTQGSLLSKVLEGKGETGLVGFIHKVFGLDAENARSLALEDVYTAIHKAVSRNQAIKGYDTASLKQLEKALSERIGQAINIDICRNLEREGYLVQFIRHLQQSALHNTCAVISLNWDILLDRKLGEERQNQVRTYVDYGTHCSGLGNKDDRVKPALLAKRDKEPVVPLLKLHGSLNWLVCPQCERLYVNWTRKIGLEAHTCRACAQDNVYLQPSIILPTFQKTLDTFHYRHIWNQAAIEISEASKLVFLGYSFPLADFDFRALITKHLPTNTEIEVVLHASDEANGTGKRYVDYFGPDRCTVRYDGVEAYVDSLTAQLAPSP